MIQINLLLSKLVLLKNVSEIVAADISKKLGTRVEVRPTLVSDPVMYRILVGPEHKDQIINVIADLMDLGSLIIS